MGLLSNARPIAIVCTRDRGRAAAFYRDVLGLDLVREDAFAAIFECGGVELRVSLVADWVAHGHTILGFDVPDLDAAVKALVERGVSFKRFAGFSHDALGIWTAPDKSARVAWLADPDENLLSLTQFL